MVEQGLLDTTVAELNSPVDTGAELAGQLDTAAELSGATGVESASPLVTAAAEHAMQMASTVAEQFGQLDISVVEEITVIDTRPSPNGSAAPIHNPHKVSTFFCYYCQGYILNTFLRNFFLLQLRNGKNL